MEFTIEAENLDARNWVYDFGSFAGIKQWLEQQFDHKLLIASDDPARETLESLAHMDPRCASIVILPKVGCEAFAQYIFNYCASIIGRATLNRAKLVSVKVSEHGSNSATFFINE